METQELVQKIKNFLIPNKMDVAYVSCIKRGMSREQIKELGKLLDQLWEAIEKDNNKFNELTTRNYECLKHEQNNYIEKNRWGDKVK